MTKMQFAPARSRFSAKKAKRKKGYLRLRVVMANSSAKRGSTFDKKKLLLRRRLGRLENIVPVEENNTKAITVGFRNFGENFKLKVPLQIPSAKATKTMTGKCCLPTKPLLVSNAMGQLKQKKRSEIPNEKSKQAIVLNGLLGSLSTVKNCALLEHWLLLIARTGVSNQKGVLPDNSALEIFRRILAIDQHVALSNFETLIDYKQAPELRTGYFQLSLSGALIGFAASNRNRLDWNEWVENQISFAFQKRNIFPDPGMRLSLIASYVGLYLLCSGDNFEEAYKTKLVLKNCLLKLKAKADKRLFLQSFVDTLGWALTDNVIKKHQLKLLAVSKYISKKSVVWPTSAFVEYFEELRHYLREVKSKLSQNPTIS